MGSKIYKTVDSVETLHDALDRVRSAQKKYATYTQAEVDRIFLAAASAADILPEGPGPSGLYRYKLPYCCGTFPLPADWRYNSYSFAYPSFRIWLHELYHILSLSSRECIILSAFLSFFANKKLCCMFQQHSC